MRPETQQRLDRLRTLAAERPSHARYLAQLEAVSQGLTDSSEIIEQQALVPIPQTVSNRVAEALQDDLTWILMAELPREGFFAQYDNAYDELRTGQARAAHRRKQTIEGREDSLEGLLRFPKRGHRDA